MKASGIATLVEAHCLGDDAHFRAVAGALSSHLPAREKSRVDSSLKRRAATLLNLAGIPGSIQREEPTKRLDSLVLQAGTLSSLQGLLEEVREADALAVAGLVPASTLLLLGPPGTGKSSVAAALAAELGTPLYRVCVEALVDSHLGGTGERLHKLAEAARSMPGVWLLDEVDTLAASRGGREDVGEAHRVVTALLAALDSRARACQSGSLLVASSNVGDELDTAVVRRFDVVLRLGYPDSPEAVAALLAKHLHRSPTPEEVGLAAGMSPADVAAACLAHRKAVVLARSLTLLEALGARRASAPVPRGAPSRRRRQAGG